MVRDGWGTVLLLLMCLAAFGQDQPDKVLQVFQFPADRIPRIDGDASDWAMVPESYVVSSAQMRDDTGKYPSPNSKTLDIRVKVGWVKGMNRLYFLYEADDNFWDFSDPGLHNDTFEVVVDGDLSGEPLNPKFRLNPATSEDDARRTMYGMGAQNYHIFTPAEGKDWAMVLGCQPWIKELPYANHAQRYSFHQGQSGHYTLEFSITPFDYAGCEGPGRAVESRLIEGKEIGLGWAVIDYDGPGKSDAFWNLSSKHTMWGIASQLRAFRLMPLEPGLASAIRALWGFQHLDGRRVAFEDRSEGTVTAWKWDFGDGTTSTERNPVHAYKEAGNFVVVLDVDGPAGHARLSKVWDVQIR